MIVGDIVNWVVLGKFVKGMGGVMDFVNGVEWVIVLMEYVVKDGLYKIVEECFLLFIGKCCVDWIVIDFVVIDVIEVGLVLCELVLGVIVDEVCVVIGSVFEVFDDVIEIMIGIFV